VSLFTKIIIVLFSQNTTHIHSFLTHERQHVSDLNEPSSGHHKLSKHSALSVCVLCVHCGITLSVCVLCVHCGITLKCVRTLWDHIKYVRTVHTLWEHIKCVRTLWDYILFTVIIKTKYKIYCPVYLKHVSKKRKNSF
jgi:hypothetical protein